MKDAYFSFAALKYPKPIKIDKSLLDILFLASEMFFSIILGFNLRFSFI